MIISGGAIISGGVILQSIKYGVSDAILAALVDSRNISSNGHNYQIMVIKRGIVWIFY